MKTARTIRWIVLALLVGGIFFMSWFTARINQTYEVPVQKLHIEQGLTTSQISGQLYEQGIIPSRALFGMYLKFKGREGNIIAGDYQLPAEMSMRELALLLSDPGAINWERTITVIEGWTTDEIAAYLSKEGVVSEEEWYAVVGRPRTALHAGDIPDFSNEFTFLRDKPNKYGLEGYLFPDTYNILKTADAEQIVKRMLATFGKKMTPEMREEIQRQGKSLYDIVILASILEREVRSEKDKKLAAGVFYNRLKIGMPLQADATVNYATGKSSPAVSYEDLQVDSPYNTYKYKGLPPTPISNPGQESLIAAVYPTETDYLYYLTDKEGTAYFARTLAEHNANRRKYLVK